MLTLHDLQSSFRRYLAGEPPDGLLQTVDGVGFAPEARMAIYRNNTLSTLSAALKATFPVVCRLVDDRFFDYAASTFIRENLPTSPCLTEYGGDFPGFLASFAPAANLDYLPDVARLEWAINRVLHAPSCDAALPIAALTSVEGDPAHIRLSLDPASKYVVSRYPVDHIWRSNLPGNEPAELVLEGRGVHLEIRRMEGIQIVGLTPAVFAFRSQIAEGSTLATAASKALAVDADFDLALALTELFGTGLVAGCLGVDPLGGYSDRSASTYL
jgi:hypothetical protein